MRAATRSIGIVVVLGASVPIFGGTPITVDDRVDARRAVEEVYWRHRIWPAENPGEKPPLEDVLSSEAIRAQVVDGLRKSAALNAFWGRPIGHDQLQAEIDRIGRDSRSPAMLAEIMEALGNDATLFAEVVARPTLADRLIRRWHAAADEAPFESWWKNAGATLPDTTLPAEREAFEPPAPRTADCTDDTWQSVESDPPDPANSPIAVWTGSEMLVWGGVGAAHGARYDPATDTWTRIPHAGGPGSRAGATGVWTGTVLIVWGGGDLNTGAQFDPATNAWTPLSMSGSVPSGRSGHTAVWTGTQMLVWGGQGGTGSMSQQVNTGARYTPSTGTWQAMALANVPSPRTGHTAVWTGSQMVVYGGYSFPSGLYLNDGGRYDPATDTWLPLTPGLTARASHTAVWTGSRMVVFGGINNGITNTGGMYDPVSNTWVATSLTGAPSQRSEHGAVWTGSRMLVWGDSITGGSFDPATNSWTAMSVVGAPASRNRFGTVWTGSEMLVWGGVESFWGAPVFKTGGRYSPASNTWLPMSVGGEGLPPARSDAGVVWTGAEAIVVGGNDGTAAGIASAYRYDPAVDSWFELPNGTISGDLSKKTVWTGVVVFAGGSPAARFDPQANVWRTVSSSGAPSSRSFDTAVWTGTHVIVWGGQTNNVDSNTGGRYDPRGDTWSATSTSGAPSPRAGHVAIWTGDRMLIWGGSESSNPRNTGGLYNPVTNSWTAMSNVNAPQARFSPAGVWAGTRFLAWGGRNHVTFDGFNTGGLYDPVSNTWNPTSLGAGVPAPRFGHSLTWTGTVALVWGGRRQSASSFYEDGARYDPATNSWAPVSTTGAPSPRSDHAAVRMDRQVFIWGGTPVNANGARYCLGPCSPSPWYPDADLDGYGTESDVINACDPPSGYVRSRGDCDDLSAAVNPSVTEACNGIDDDCDAATDEVDADGDGHTCAVDCNDTDARVYPGASESCDLLNNNCLDPSWPTLPPAEVDADADGYRPCSGECNDANATVYPFAEQLCDGLNNDCLDHNWPAVPANEADADGDGVRICQGDCNDGNASVNPTRAEICNAIDDDCDTRVDEDRNEVVDADGDGLRGVCDNCPDSVNLDQLDTDADGPGDACDNCLSDSNTTQTDFNADGQGDLCDLDDGVIYIFTTDKNYIEWQQESGPTTWNVYEGDLDVLKATGAYSQLPGSSPIAERTCGLVEPRLLEFFRVPALGKVKFALVTGVADGTEWWLGTNSVGAQRPNTNPCP